MRAHPVVIASAARTPIGRLGGALSKFPAHRLGALAIAAALRKANIDPLDVDDVIIGQVLTAGAGQNPARQASVSAGLPLRTTAATVNQVCGSGLRAVILACQAIRGGDANIAVAGGQESMSQAPHFARIRSGAKFGDVTLGDTVISDGLQDAFQSIAMGVTAENVARLRAISREAQDEFALRSQLKAAAAQRAGHFAEEMASVPGDGGEAPILADEAVRPDATAEKLAALRPVFASANGTVTAGNSSGLSDGAAAVVLLTEAEARRRGISPLARVVAWAQTGVAPELMGLGPVSAVNALLAKAGWNLAQVDLIEANEAFAAQCCAVGLDLNWDSARVNLNGGAIALGHPLGASGCRILVTLLHAMKSRGARRGLATLCVGGGMGIALAVERD